MNRVIITGPTGAVGIALIQKLIAHKISVLAVCRKGSARISHLPKSDYVNVLECDLELIGQIPDMVEGTYDTFYHFAWDGTFGNSRNNMKGQEKNIKYTLDAVGAAEKLGCKTFIGAGSQAEYGRVEGILSPETPAFPENGYGMAKLCAGQMSRGMCEQKGIRHIWPRILSIYGPYDSEKTMIMSTIEKLEKGEKPALTKGEQQWDYLYSEDVGNAMYLLGEKGHGGKVYCIGSGKVRPLLEYVDILRKKCNPLAQLGIGELPYAPKQVMYLCADISDLEHDVGFRPEYSFEEGIQKTINWYRNQKTKKC